MTGSPHMRHCGIVDGSCVIFPMQANVERNRLSPKPVAAQRMVSSINAYLRCTWYSESAHDGQSVYARPRRGGECGPEQSRLGQDRRLRLPPCRCWFCLGSALCPADVLRSRANYLFLLLFSSVLEVRQDSRTEVRGTIASWLSQAPRREFTRSN